MTDEIESLKNFSPEHPLLLLTDYAPDAAGGGAVILRDLLGPDERDRVVWLSPSPFSGTVNHDQWLQSGSAGRKSRRSLGLDSTIYSASLAQEVEKIAEERQARAVWIVLHGAAVGIASRLSRLNKLPIHVTVHDDPAFANALRSKRYLALVPLIARDFATSLRAAKSVDVICEAMRERYLNRYGVDSVVVHRGLSQAITPSDSYPGKTLRVGVLGSTYAYDQLPILGRAVALAAASLNVPGEVVVMGKSYGERLRDELGGQIEVKVTGHVDEAGAIPLLRDCFALYLNYPFGWRDQVLRQTSFPTKLSTYIQAARPLLLHVPSDSSVMPLIKQDHYATPWHSLNEREGADILTRLWLDPASHRSQHVEAEAVRQCYYDRSKNRRTLFQALDSLVS